MTTIKVLTDFSSFPGPRYCKQGKDSGELFYHSILNEKFAAAYKNNEQLCLDLDGTDGYMSSFLDEAIGNLVYDFGEDVVKKTLIVVSNEENVWIQLINNQVLPEWEERRQKGIVPQKTSKTPLKPWYRINEQGDLESKVWI